MKISGEVLPGTLRTLDRCPACESNAALAERIAEDFVEMYGERQYFSVDLCPQCGLIYSRTRSRDERLYTPALDLEKEHGHQRPGLSPISPDVWNLQTKSMQVAEIISASPSTNSLRYLEVGASDGMLFRMVHQRLGESGRDMTATLIESSGAAEPCAQISGCQVFSQSLLAPLPAEVAGYDIAVLSHCLEHFDNPREVLSKVRELLRPGGVLYVEVPDGLRYDRCVSTPLGFLHVTNFNLINLAWMIGDVGFVRENMLQRDHYPGLRVIARKLAHETAQARETLTSLSSEWSRSALEQWREARAEAFARLEHLKDPGQKRFLVYGAGVHSIALFNHFPRWLESGQCDLADSNSRLQHFLGHRVLHGNQIDFARYDHVVISSYAYQEIISRQLVEQGCPENRLIRLYDRIFAYVA